MPAEPEPIRSSRGHGDPAQVSLGVLLPRDLPADQVLGFASRAEAIGVTQVWVVEDLGYRGGVAQAAAVLAYTARLRVGIGVLPAAARGVVTTAMEIATLAELFPGRIDVGIGHGMRAWMRQAGVWPRSPLSALEEVLTGLTTLLRGERLTADGRHVRVDGVRLENPPTHVPPVLAGVRGPRSLAVAGRVADGAVLAEPVTPGYARAALAAMGSRHGQRLVAYALCSVHVEVASARRAVRPALAVLAEPDWAPHLQGLAFAHELELLRTRCADGNEMAARMPDAWVDELALVGPQTTVRAGIERLHEAGVTDVVLLPVGEPFAALDGFAELTLAPEPA